MRKPSATSAAPVSPRPLRREAAQDRDQFGVHVRRRSCSRWTYAQPGERGLLAVEADGFAPMPRQRQLVRLGERRRADDVAQANASCAANSGERAAHVRADQQARGPRRRAFGGQLLVEPQAAALEQPVQQRHFRMCSPPRRGRAEIGGVMLTGVFRSRTSTL